MKADRIDELLPWTWPFRMIDRMVECEPHRSIVTIKQLPANEGEGGVSREGFPGVLLIEGMSQSAALLFRLSYDDIKATRPLLGFLKASLPSRVVWPGDVITFSVGSMKMTRTGGVFEAEATLDGEVIATAELAFAMREGVES